MMPFPPEIVKLCEKLRGSDRPERPWWRWVGWTLWQRIDGRTERGDLPLEALAAIDVTDPLPFPPLRAGQVWARVVEGVLITFSVGATSDPGLGASKGSVRVVGLHETMAEFEKLAREYQRFLVFDPFDPDLCWAPPAPEEVP